jgi:D-glutamate N-acetyltransferase
VTLGLLHGSMPRGMILCHQTTRDFIGDYHGREPWVRIPPLAELVELHERAAAPVCPSKVIGVCLNTYDMDEPAAREAIDRASRETGLPVTDPVRFDPLPLVDAVIRGAAARRD